ncbi:hypothetical protein PF005_g2207 [Phytophthora fragariae]|uniref:WW domain-containing protein n=1 Tax=Phytophthora fragariae TaxID=53985 RepID=A0A6A3THI2_9STRA|nr:hypothetical protein PF007_g2263 [Phytophthora fragariae]KAE9233733.1 hypothetical protein PF005_g2207 [Phytophthora fragariae]KAE9252885.1 hypothetical protein PF004_g1772 [Phytophthora fragariae]KAE9327144.1 hypothetical protein PF001_g2072 [Phytophthora fragariae]
MLGGIFHKRKKSQELRSPSLQDLKKFRDAYAKYAELRQVDPPPCFEKSIYKAIAGQKELHTVEFRQEDITDPQMIALAETLLEMPIVSSLDLRDNRITDDGAKALLEVLRLQIIAAKTPPTIDPRTKRPLYPPLPEYTRYVTNVNLKGNEVSASVLQELSQYMDVLRREDKRLEIRAALNRIDRNSDGGIDEEEFKDDEVRSAYSHRGSKSLVTSGSSSHQLSDDKSVSAPSRREASFSGNETPRELTTAKESEYSSGGQDEKRSLPGSVVSTPRFDDLSSLVYREADEGGRSTENMRPTFDQPEEDEEVEERVDSLVFDVIKDGKERYVGKLIHSEFRSGLSVTDFPAEFPFRNLLALLLPDNGLSDLTLFAECRFPFVTVLDLSKNKLSKLADDGLTAFPRLEVLNLGNNQLKIITGLTKILKLRALCVSHNAIRTVTNVEHLLQLEILQLANNHIATVHALRILSLNKVLAHLNLDGNPVVETDERQKRKNIVHVRNLLPALQSLGSIPCAGLHTKDKKKTNSSASPGKSLFDSDLVPAYKTLWVSTACDTLHILQDATSHGSGQSQQDDDEWDTRDEDGGDDRSKRPLTREQQRQKDEIRSRAIGFRSRGKAIPSPPKVKTSVFCFGPPQPPTINKKKKKTAPADLKVLREQQRRASELSAPKHAPVDKTLMHREQKRKSRVDFHVAMTVGERLQLARDMTQRCPTATIGLSARSRSILAKADSRKRTSTAASTTLQEETIGPEGNLRSLSPQRTSPMKDAMFFRVDSANTPRSPKGALTFRVDPYPSGLGGQHGSPKNNGAKEAGFLHDLAVSDFLNHAEEEFSTALTALNVLLSMSEKEQGDSKKLADYRASLDALDILNENESQELFKTAQGHPEHELQTQCADWFTKLGVVKKCMRQLLEKLEVHAPGSGVIRAYCRCIRSNELRGIITTMLESQEEDLSQPHGAENIDVDSKQEDALLEQEQASAQPIKSDAASENPHQEDPAPSSVASRLFGETASRVHDENNSTSRTFDDDLSGVKQANDLSTGDTGLDFLKSTETIFDDDKAPDANATIFHSADDMNSTLDRSSIPESVLLASTTDITMDIQMNEDTSSNQNVDDSLWMHDTVEDNGGGEEETIATEVEQVNAQDDAEGTLEQYGSEDHDIANAGEEDEETIEASVEATTSPSEEYDWLANSELGTESNDADSFEHDMAAVSEGESDTAGQEQAEPPQDDDWPPTETTEPTIEKGEEIFDEAHNGVDDEVYKNEEAYENGDIEDNDNYNVDVEVAAEDTEATDSQYELGGAVDADDEEAETFGDWEKGFDPNSNHYFWFNHSTGESSWTPPEGWPYEVDEPFSADNEDTTEGGEAGVEQQDEGYEEGTDAQEYEEGVVEDQDYAEGTAEGAEGQEYDAVNAEGQYYEESAAEGQYYEEGAEDQTYEEGGAEDQYYEDGAVQGETQEYDEGAADDQTYYEGAVEENPTDGQWYDETAANDQEYVPEDHEYEVATGEGHAEDQGGEESPRRSEVSDFEFDDSDLPGF